MLRKPVLTACLLAMLCPLAFSAESSWNTETASQRDARLQWWRDARFGMFIHWGLYAIPAGKWDGKDVPGIGEWIMDRANVPVEQYEKLAGQFNPVKFDAAGWAKSAKQAGIKYLVITSKHHDGFCLFGTKATKYNVVDGTPYKKDLLKPLAEACRKEGIKFCTYYSIMDWHHPAQYRADEKKYNPTKIHAERKKEYVDFMKQQLKELIEEVDTEMLWFDGEWPDWWTEEDGRDLYKYLRGLKPSLLINNRIGKGRKGMEGLSKGDRDYVGDFGTPEQQIPATGIPGVDWESCMTMNDTWGFKSYDHKWKSAETLIRNLIDIASKGGNYLLNVGPTAAGEIPGASIERLQDMGRWMQTNGESIYGTKSSPFDSTPWGRCTRKKVGANTRLYLHVFNWPQDGKLVLEGLASKPLRAYLLEGSKSLDATAGENRVTIALPPAMPDKTATVVALDVEGEAKIVKVNPYADETPQQRDARMKWWREARFGMFIHWGVYSVPAGFYKGQPVKGIGEWIMNRGKIPVGEYKEYAKRFNPMKYDADQWVRLAKEAGMKYIVITSKHHDGFAMFDSKASPWNIVAATPFKRDPLKELSAACQKHGVKLGFYYSQAQDWCNPGGAAAGGSWDKAQEGNMDDYVRNVAVPQVREILSNYGPIAVLWWDTPVAMNPQRAEMLLPLVRLQPGIIVNNRLGGGYSGDTETPEQFIPPTGYPGRDWETCMTMNDTWGFKSDDHNWKSTEVLLRNLVDIASKGGNYLLNVGPTSEGLIPDPSVQRLKEVGQWMRRNGEAIYATSASPFKRLPWGRSTRKAGPNGTTTLFLHVFDWPADGKLVVPGLKNQVAEAYLLTDARKSPLAATRAENNWTLSVPAVAPDKFASVVVLRIKGEPDVEPILLAQAADGSLALPAVEAITHGDKVKLETKHRAQNIGYWLNPSDWVEWKFEIAKPGTFEVVAELAAEKSGSFQVVVGDTRLKAAAPVTKNYDKYQAVKLGKITLNAGKGSLAIRPIKEGWRPMNVRNITLKPAK